MKRRTFLASAILGTAALEIGCRQSPDHTQPPQIAQLIGAEELLAIGNSVMLQIGGKEKLLAEWEKIDGEQASLIRKDFEQGKIMVAAGWVLSRTEALHTALFTSSTPAHAR